MAIKTFREYLRALSPSWLLGELSEKFTGLVLGYTHDALADFAGFALRVSWVREDSVPVDALPHLGRNFGLQRYPAESPPQFIERMSGAWALWQFAGHESTIESQIETLGFVGVEVWTPSEASIAPVGYWSHFVVYFPIGSHGVSSAGKPWGGFNWGDGTKWGPIGITAEELESIRAIIRQWKPADWICRAVVFQITGVAWGTFNWNTENWGGTLAVVGP